MASLDQLNAMSPDAFIGSLEGVFENAPWVAGAAAPHRPFASVSALHAALMAAAQAAPDDLCLEFLRGHPPLSPQALADPQLTASSRAEQQDLGISSLGDQLALFEACSAAYEARFGIPFIVCVRRQTPAFVLRGLRQRLTHTSDQERAAALAEIGHITRLRLVDRVTGPGLPRVAGQLSAHVLDTARGRAAAGIPIEVLREGVLIRQGVTNQAGRTDAPLLADQPLRIGRYELRFDVADYYAGWPGAADPPFYDVIPIRFSVAEPEGHYHIPLLLNAWSYTTYRGS